MTRLVQGDVGSGKTIVAFLAMIMTAENGYQSAIMVPTEVLARQHYEALTKLLEENELLEQYRPVLLTGSNTAKEKRQIYEAIASGSDKDDCRNTCVDSGKRSHMKVWVWLSRMNSIDLVCVREKNFHPKDKNRIFWL